MSHRIILFLAILLAVVSGIATAQTPTSGLTENEVNGLLLMREEEKLARDVYLSLAEIWNIRVFENIAGSEQTHMDRVEGLLESFGIPDPVKDESNLGEFSDPVLQELYDELMERGQVSSYEALLVGRDIEELDIDDLQNLMSRTDNSEILLVYENLLRGSENHLNAFNRQLSR